jgi:hypothetical protein
MKELLRGDSTISLEAAVLKCPNAELYLYPYLTANCLIACKLLHHPMVPAGYTPHKVVSISHNYSATVRTQQTACLAEHCQSTYDTFIMQAEMFHM